MPQKVRILVTGAQGQLGNELQAMAQTDRGVTFTFIDVEELDLTNEDSMNEFFRDKSFDFVVNAAAYTDVDGAQGQDNLAFAVNARAVSSMAEICRDKRIRFIHLSTDYVFDGTGNRPIDETVSPNPLSVYGKSKREGEMVLLSVLPDAYIIRTSWLYSSFGRNFVKTIMRLSYEREEITVIADQAGSPTYARDLASAILTIIGSIHKGIVDVPGIYHYANEGLASWYDLACAVIRYTGSRCEISPIKTGEFPSKAPRPAYAVLDKRKIRDTFGLKIPNWYDSLHRCLKELKQT